MNERPLGDQFPFVDGKALGIDNKETKKVWGSYTDYYRTDSVVFKTIQVNPNQRLSLQSHEKRSEIWFVKEGKCTCVLDDKTIVLTTGSSIIIPRNSKHRLENHTDDVCVVAEMQFGICSEDDITRYEDDYGRI
tara:strand:- start:653 stop:1054 length:402 start_codon:yes stop_codon:yes gene_type:complete